MTQVLVVDDDRSILRMLRLTFRSSGFDVRTAENGAQALAECERQPPDAIILDLNMPVMDGETFLRELRARGSTVPVIVVSGREAHVSPRRLGADAYVAKPFRLDALLDAVHEALRSAAPERPAARHGSYGGRFHGRMLEGAAGG